MEMDMFRPAAVSTCLILLCASSAASAQVNINFRNAPQLSYHDELFFLRLPYVDAFEGIPGLYHNATVEYSPRTNTWRAYGFTRSVPIPPNEIEALDLRVVGDVPVQVFLEISGHFNDHCLNVGHAGARLDGMHFTVFVFYNPASFAITCVGGTRRPFRTVVPLEVYGLPAGTYTYEVQDAFGGAFSLTAENVLPPSLQ